MRALVQRVRHASVAVEGEERGRIDRGFVVLLGITHSDDSATVENIARKVVSLRVFEDGDGKMNLSLSDVRGSVLCISQFTLYGDVRRGNRPSFTDAAAPEQANQLYEAFCSAIRSAGIRCEQGVFAAHMEVSLVNDGPVTIMIDSEDLRRPRDA